MRSNHNPILFLNLSLTYRSYFLISYFLLSELSGRSDLDVSNRAAFPQWSTRGLTLTNPLAQVTPLLLLSINMFPQWSTRGLTLSYLTLPYLNLR